MRQIYLIEYMYDNKKHRYFVESYTKEGAKMCVREYWNLKAKDIVSARIATGKDAREDGVINFMVFSHMMIPVESRPDWYNK